MAIPSGMSMMLKSMGVDPAEIMQSVEGFKVLAENMRAAQERVESKLDEILETCDLIDTRTLHIEIKCETIITMLADHDDSPIPEDWSVKTPSELETKNV